MHITSASGQQLSLRPYQLEVVERIGQACNRSRRILLSLPTGAGKTVVAVALVQRALAGGQRVLFLVHRRELLQQASRKLHDAGIDHGAIAPDLPSRPGEPVQVASIATLHARAVRCSAMRLPPADLIIVDEAHHARARTWRRLIDAYPEATVIGLTATPCRGDGRGLGGIFETMVEGSPIAELIAGGFLVPPRVYAPSRPDLEGVRITAGDYNEKQLAERMDTGKLVGDVVTHWHRLAERRRTVVFATSVAHAVHLANEFGRSGVAAAHVDGSTPTADRDAILAKLAAGALDVVANCGVLTEGWDCPEVSCLVLARPTKSSVLYRQMVGRVLRPAPGKADCLIIDHAGATFEHGFIDEPIEWTLAADQRAERPRNAARDAGRTPRLVECPECTAVRWEGRPCTSCGWRPKPKAAPVEVREGELGRVDRDKLVRLAAPTASDRAHFHAELAWIARERGYSSGWVAHKYREKFGSWPAARIVAPIEPRPETRSWVRSRAIAWAKAQEKARAQAGAA